MVNKDSLPIQLSMKMPHPFLNDRHISRSRASTKSPLLRPRSASSSGVGHGADRSWSNHW